MLNFNHIPFHLMCVSHTCGVFDCGNMVILKELEMKIKLREAVIARMTALKSFLTNKSVTISALEALNKLVINVKCSTKSWKKWEIMQGVGWPLYQQRRDRNLYSRHQWWKETKEIKLHTENTYQWLTSKQGHTSTDWVSDLITNVRFLIRVTAEVNHDNTFRPMMTKSHWRYTRQAWTSWLLDFTSCSRSSLSSSWYTTVAAK